MNASSLRKQHQALPSGGAVAPWLHGLLQGLQIRLRTLRRSPAQPDPSVEQIVDLIMASASGESCHVRLNPRLTRVKNVVWLLPICVQQFGTTIEIQQRPLEDDVLLTITVTGRRHSSPAPQPPVALAARERALGA